MPFLDQSCWQFIDLIKLFKEPTFVFVHRLLHVVFSFTEFFSFLLFPLFGFNLLFFGGGVEELITYFLLSFFSHKCV